MSPAEMKSLTPFILMRAEYDAILIASCDARLFRDAARKAARSAIAAAIKEFERRMFLCDGYSWDIAGSRPRKVGDEIKAASGAYDKAVKEARDHYDRVRKYAATATSKARKARYALDAASYNESDHPTA